MKCGLKAGGGAGTQLPFEVLTGPIRGPDMPTDSSSETSMNTSPTPATPRGIRSYHDRWQGATDCHISWVIAGKHEIYNEQPASLERRSDVAPTSL